MARLGLLVALVMGALVGPAPRAWAGSPLEEPCRSLEHQLERLYRAYFLRPSDADGMAFWLNEYLSGVTLAHISGTFAGSDEFRSRYGDVDDEGFVRLAYENVFGREVDADGLAHWLGLLAAGATRGDLMAQLSESSEFVRLTETIGQRWHVTPGARMYCGGQNRELDLLGSVDGPFILSVQSAGGQGVLVTAFANDGTPVGQAGSDRFGYGRFIVGTPNLPPAAFLAVEAPYEDWLLTVLPLDAAPLLRPGETRDGYEPEVFRFDGGPSTLRVRNDGYGPVRVRGLFSGGLWVLAEYTGNEAYEVSIPLDVADGWIEVSAGRWFLAS